MQDSTLASLPPADTLVTIDTLVTVDSTVTQASAALDLPLELAAPLILLGAAGFGLVVGWVTYRTIRRSETSGLTDIAAVIGAVGGAAVTALFPAGTAVFGAYGIGLAVGFFLYFAIYIWMYGKKAIAADPEEHALLGGAERRTPPTGNREPDNFDVPPREP